MAILGPVSGASRGGSGNSDIFVLIFLCALAVMIVVPAISNCVRWRGIANWPRTQAQVQGGEVRLVGGKHPYYLSEIAYSFTVDGSYYSGYLQQKFGSEDEAWANVEKLRNATIGIKYKPSDPGVSRMA